jgi:hypothetical protein
MSLLVAAPAFAADKSADEQYKALLDEFEQDGNARLLSKRFFTLAEENPSDPTATQALLWVIAKVRGRSDTTRALELITRHHLKSEQLAEGCGDIARSRSAAAETLLRTILDKSPHAAVRAQACYNLALLLENEANIVDQLRKEPELAPRVLQYYGRDYGGHLAALNPTALKRQREEVYEQMQASFTKAEVQGMSLGEVAERALFALHHLSVGTAAPEIEGENIHGLSMRLSEHRGKVVMLTFWGHW